MTTTNEIGFRREMCSAIRTLLDITDDAVADPERGLAYVVHRQAVERGYDIGVAVALAEYFDPQTDHVRLPSELEDGSLVIPAPGIDPNAALLSGTWEWQRLPLSEVCR